LFELLFASALRQQHLQTHTLSSCVKLERRRKKVVCIPAARAFFPPPSACFRSLSDPSSSTRRTDTVHALHSTEVSLHHSSSLLPSLFHLKAWILPTSSLGSTTSCLRTTALIARAPPPQTRQRPCTTVSTSPLPVTSIHRLSAEAEWETERMTT